MKSINIELDKQHYLAGDTAKGIVNILVNKETNDQNLIFAVYGEEKIRIAVGAGPHSELYSASNIFFNQDLSSFLTSNQDSLYQNKVLDMTKDYKQIPFEFTIPKDALQTYDGKYAYINYMINAKKVKKSIFKNIDEKLSFRVTKLENRKTIPNNNIVICTKNTEGTSLRVELGGNIFHAGETLKGRLMVSNPAKKSIKGAEIILKGSEYAIGQEESVIRIDTGFGINFNYTRKNKKTEKIKEMTSKIDEYKVNVECKEDESVSFEINLPMEMKKSYIGKFSRYSWVVGAKLDIAWSRDLYGEAIVQIS